MAGFPCQPFSDAGKKRAFNDEKGRGQICWNILEYIKAKRPKIFILEIIRGFVKLHNGKHMRRIPNELRNIKDAMGQAYEIEHQVINTKEQGIPQNRPRW